jgi:hypothetical protein
MQFIAVPSLLLSKLGTYNVIGYIWWLRARTEGSPRDASGVPARRTAALSWAAHDILAAAAGLPPTPDPAIRKLQKSLQGYYRHPLRGDLFESGLAL